MVELSADSCGKAGFKVVDKGAKNFFDADGDLINNRFDVALFGWAGSSLVSGWASTFTTPAACTPSQKGNNNGCYSNKQVDKLIKQLNATIDPDQKTQLIAQIEKLLWDDLATLPLYSQRALSAWTDSLKNIKPNPPTSSEVGSRSEVTRTLTNLLCQLVDGPVRPAMSVHPCAVFQGRASSTPRTVP